MTSPHHVCAPLLSLAQRRPDDPVLIDADPSLGAAVRTTTGSQLLHRVSLLSRAVSACLAPGSVVVLAAQASSAMLEVLLAALDAGCVVCPVNWRWTPLELAEALARLSPAAILYDGACAELTRLALASAYHAGPQAASVADPYQHSAACGDGCSPQQRPGRQPPLACLIDHPRCDQQQQQRSHGCQPTTAAARPPPFITVAPPAALTTAGLLHAAAAAAAATATPSTTASAAAPTSTTAGGPQTAAPSTASPQPQPPHPPHHPLQPQLLAPPSGGALLVFTSGTTAAPKGVLLTHAAFHAQSQAKLALVGYGPADTYLHLAPLFHIGGLSSACAALMGGAAHVFLPRFEAGAALRAIVRQRVTAFIAVPTMLQDLAAAAAAAGLSGTDAAAAPLHDGAEAGAAAAGLALGPAAAAWQDAGRGDGGGGGVWCVQRILVGAGGTSPALQSAVARTFPRAHLLSAYGMTEACSSITFCSLSRPTPASHASGAAWASTLGAPPNRARTAAERVGPGQGSVPVAGVPPAGGVFVGWPASGVQVMIGRSAELDEREGPGAAGTAGGGGGGDGSSGVDSVSSCAPHAVGEVLTRGPHVMAGYWRDAAATTQALRPGGWLRTGDLGYLAADGGLWLMGRAKDMIKSGGENVFAPQVETALGTHPAVAAVAVVGLPDERLGEQVAALVVLRDGWGFAGPCLEQPPQPAAHPASPTTAGTASTRVPDGNGTIPETAASGAMAAGAGGSVAGTTSLADLQAHCRAQGLAGFRLPRFAAAQWQPLPTNGSGKVQKPVVRERLAALRAGPVRSRM
ncbi:2-succinylbenzoate--CoA ligase, chloroplastic/peroxisomal [Tetrabaena socialis]|uniref:2-succinylbenzoate--CoA ligase, chloroplastic/peroxisomal n=1 Tax=Tetrabaena socialis TaxID=47790 RepID=A0A2J8ACN8_9CHLO|nr:2-succinylbenzoate--CoA ligase, chloroplastic/peroxisomal [Tetrabaena socialis]|eukprot:PNH10278.1 2-succinylbenzoate--CoA ligase, chloroplastic/peroxisomal [Tetrabaena socialis]